VGQTFAVVIPYFNPVGYRSHSHKLSKTLEAFRRYGLGDHVYLAGAGSRPAITMNAVFWDERCDFLWHKERLINLAAARLDGYSHIVWVDSDVIIGADWAAAVEYSFTQARVVQCFRTARYADVDYRTGARKVSRTRVSALVPEGEGAIGLAWGARRSLFTDGPGLFELGLVGGGDSVFALGVLRHTDTTSVPWLSAHRSRLAHSWSPSLLKALDEWVEGAASWQGSTPAIAAQTDVQIIEHGSVTQRAYNARHHLLAAVDPGLHLTASSEEVHRWTSAGLASVEESVRAYFHERQEDDHLLATDESAA
jgi:hypothetical protein